MDDIKVFTLIVTTGGVIITAILTHILTLKREKFAKTYEYKVKMLKELYAPMYKVLFQDIRTRSQYKGINSEQFKQLDEICRENIELVDPMLQNIIYEAAISSDFSEDFENSSEPSLIRDKDGKLFAYVQFQYNYFRKNLGLPFDRKITNVFSFPNLTGTGQLHSVVEQKIMERIIEKSKK
ncbi:hypothetical protein [Bacillus cereus group sp. BfR-BA-01355]|uniref:hypothetical protein n=1 Tax=Bacillus cereus group sp. BfR-BA-01355 TaxID=2920318 RepID=UPI001F59CBEA|nr:hypothetical protein [Bacillus cereus group sp. BfR-BA-01355]